MVFIYTQEIFIQPPGEPRENHLGEIRQNKFRYSLAHFEESAIKLKMKSQDRKKIVFGKFLRKRSKNIRFFWSCDSCDILKNVEIFSIMR